VTFDPANTSVVYPLFNDGWDFVIGNRKNQQRRQLSAIDRAQQLPRYLNYCAHSLGSLRREHGDGVDVRVRLVEISPDGVSPAEVAHLFGKRVPGPPVVIEQMPFATLKPFINEAEQIPVELYRSPNRLHEFILLDTIRSASKRWVAIVDSDLTFLAKDALWKLGGELASRPEKWMGAFLERPQKKPWQGGTIITRERMHSVLLLADAERMRAFPYQPFLRVSTLEERLAILSDASVRQYYLDCRVLDTFALVTDWLRQDGDRVLDLSTVLESFREGQMLTMLSELFLHAKFLDDNALQAIRETIDQAGAPLNQNPRLKSIRERLGSGLILQR
jgi:hypothetical protein